jgi:hypothetical protein
MTAAAPDLNQIAWTRLVHLLAPRLGRERGREVLTDAAARLGMRPDQMDFAQAMELLDELAGAEGLVGVVAHFAKSRLMLRGPR